MNRLPATELMRAFEPRIFAYEQVVTIAAMQRAETAKPKQDRSAARAPYDFED